MAYDENIYAKIISGELAESEIQKLKETGEWQEIQEILKATDQLVLPKHNKDSAYDKLVKERLIQKPKFAKRIILSMASAAAAALVLIGLFFFYSKDPLSFNAANGSISEINLSDQSKVILNDGSSLLKTSEENSASRDYKLIGEAYFEVTQNNSRFTVNTQNGSIQVLGTKFNIRSWGSNLFVDCYSGKVAVQYAGQKIILSQMEQAVCIGGKIEKMNNNKTSKPVWLNGTSSFRQESLKEVFLELERQYDLSLTFPESSKSFTGKFSHDNMEQALDQICIPMGLKYEIINTNTVRVYE